MKKNYILFPLFIVAVILIIFFLLMGVQYLASILLDFEFTSFYGPLFLTLNIFVGFILLIPLSLFLQTLVDYTGFANRGGHILSEVIQLTLFVFYMDVTVMWLDIARFQSTYTEMILYVLMYFAFYGLAKMGDVIKKEDQQSLDTIDERKS
jgi:hypothetical protein